mgnify:CR=1 FL=1
MYEREDVVNALIKIYEGKVKFIYIGDCWVKFKYDDRMFRVKYNTLLTEECIDKFILQSDDYTEILQEKLKEELYLKKIIYNTRK